jgi:hypothetical protein
MRLAPQFLSVTWMCRAFLIERRALRMMPAAMRTIVGICIGETLTRCDRTRCQSSTMRLMALSREGFPQVSCMRCKIKSFASQGMLFVLPWTWE